MAFFMCRNAWYVEVALANDRNDTIGGNNFLRSVDGAPEHGSPADEIDILFGKRILPQDDLRLRCLGGKRFQVRGGGF